MLQRIEVGGPNQIENWRRVQGNHVMIRFGRKACATGKQANTFIYIYIYFAEKWEKT